MANLKEVRIRIASVTSTQQITKAMKLVSATKLRRAQNAITLMRPYATKLNGILSNLSDSIDVDSLKVYFDARPIKNVLIVVITSDRGLCGSFNANVIKLANKTIQDLQSIIPKSLPIINSNESFYDPETPLFFYRKINQTPIKINRTDEETYKSLQNNAIYQTTFVGNYQGATQNPEIAEQQMPGLKAFLGV